MRVTMKSMLLTLLGLVGAALNLSAAKPNVVFILADDLGYGDLSCFGQKTLKTLATPAKTTMPY